MTFQEEAFKFNKLCLDIIYLLFIHISENLKTLLSRSCSPYLLLTNAITKLLKRFRIIFIEGL